MKTETALAALLCLIPGVGTAEQNLLKDGGFEDAPSAWQVRLGAAIRDGDSRSGAKALMLPGPGRSDAFCGVAGLKAGQFYRVDAWAKTRGIHANPGGYAATYMDGVGSFSTNLDDHDWECVTAWFEAKDDKPFRIYVIREGIPEGEVLFDDVSLRECDNPNLKPVTFEDGSTLGLVFSRGPNSIARVVEGPTPEGKRYLSASGISVTYVMPQPIAKGDVEFSFLVRPGREGNVNLLIGMRLDFTPGIRVPNGSGNTVSLGILAPDRWYRIRGVIHLDNQTYDLTVTDYDDPLGSFQRKALKIPTDLRKVVNMWLNSSPAGTGFDDIYLGAAR